MTAAAYAPTSHAAIVVDAEASPCRWGGWWIDCECGWSGPAVSSTVAAWQTHRHHLDSAQA